MSDRDVEEISQNFINGNLEKVKQLFDRMSPRQAAYVGMMIWDGLVTNYDHNQSVDWFNFLKENALVWK